MSLKDVFIIIEATAAPHGGYTWEQFKAAAPDAAKIFDVTRCEACGEQLSKKMKDMYFQDNGPEDVWCDSCGTVQTRDKIMVKRFFARPENATFYPLKSGAWEAKLNNEFVRPNDSVVWMPKTKKWGKSDYFSDDDQQEVWGSNEVN
jgi:hypothetical protein